MIAWVTTSGPPQCPSGVACITAACISACAGCRQDRARGDGVHLHAVGREFQARDSVSATTPAFAT